MTEICKGIVDVVISLIRARSKADEAVDEKQIDEFIHNASLLLPYTLSEEEFESIRKELHHRQTIVMEPGIAISGDPDFKNWYNPEDMNLIHIGIDIKTIYLFQKRLSNRLMLLLQIL